MDTLLINNAALMKKYLSDNKIIGVFVDKDMYSGGYKIYEATSATSGFPTGDYFKTKKAAHIKALEWSNKTGLPVIRKNPVRPLSAKKFVLWKWNKVASVWQYARDSDTKQDAILWKGIFEKDEPNEIYRISKIKPDKRPVFYKNPVRPLNASAKPSLRGQPAQRGKKERQKDDTVYKVAVSLSTGNKKSWTTVSAFKTLNSAKQYAAALRKLQPYHYIKVFIP